MSFKKRQNPNHPKKGSSIKVEPIRDTKAIARIKRNLLNERKVRDYCLFSLAINTGLRANELLSIKVRDVSELKLGDILRIKESKTNKYRYMPINRNAIRAVRFWLTLYHDIATDESALFPSQRSKDFKKAITVPTLCNMVKQWCKDAEVHGQFGSHTLRKTWAYHQRVKYKVPPAILTEAMGHASEKQTMTYLGIISPEIADIYQNEL